MKNVHTAMQKNLVIFAFQPKHGHTLYKITEKNLLFCRSAFFLPFSLKTCNAPLSEIIVDFKNKKVSPERGFVLPEGATFEFVEDEDEF